MTTNQSPLRTAVGSFLAEHNRWVNDKFRPEIDQRYITAMRGVFGVLEQGNIGPADRRVEIAALELAIAWMRLESTGSENEPSNDFWHFREQLEHAFHHQDKVLESIVQLHKAGVSEEQIGRMWGLVLNDGTGDIESVAKEIANPGSVIRPGDVPLSRLKEQRELDEQRDALVAEIGAMGEVVPAEVEPVEPEPTRCPETAAQLYWQRVPVQQAAKMLGRSVAEVDAEWAQFAKEQEIREKREQLERLQAELATAEVK